MSFGKSSLKMFLLISLASVSLVGCAPKNANIYETEDSIKKDTKLWNAAVNIRNEYGKYYGKMRNAANSGRDADLHIWSDRLENSLRSEYKKLQDIDELPELPAYKSRVLLLLSDCRGKARSLNAIVSFRKSDLDDSVPHKILLQFNDSIGADCNEICAEHGGFQRWIGHSEEKIRDNWNIAKFPYDESYIRDAEETYMYIRQQHASNMARFVTRCEKKGLYLLDFVVSIRSRGMLRVPIASRNYETINAEKQMWTAYRYVASSGLSCFLGMMDESNPRKIRIIMDELKQAIAFGGDRIEQCNDSELAERKASSLDIVNCFKKFPAAYDLVEKGKLSYDDFLKKIDEVFTKALELQKTEAEAHYKFLVDNFGGEEAKELIKRDGIKVTDSPFEFNGLDE